MRIGSIGAVLLLGLGLAACSPTPAPTPSASSSSAPTRSATPTPTPTGSTGATAVLSVAGVDVDGLHATVAGFVTDLVESGGTCTFVLTPATGTAVTVTSTGAENGDTTTCASVQIPIAQLHRGSWTVVLRYHSDDADIASSSLPLEVP